MTDQPEIDPAILEAMNGLQEEFAGFAGVSRDAWARVALQDEQRWIAWFVEAQRH